MELFELIRRDAYLHDRSIRWIARERRVHRRTVRQALESSVPPERNPPVREPSVLTPPLRAVVDAWLEADREAPRKQRHTARRIFKRLRSEHGFEGAESTIRRYVGARRRELGLRHSEVFVPQTHAAGEEAEVDWYEASVDFPDGRRKVQVLQVRACFSGREFHVTFPRQTQQAFLDGLAQAFEYFGGVFAVLRFDNLSSAVQRVLRGRRRKETARFVAFRSHYLFESEFCRPGKQGAHEKGGVEGGVGRFRRTHFVPVPAHADFDALNRWLVDRCGEDDTRIIEGRRRPILEDWDEERVLLRPLPSTPFDTAVVDTYRVDAKSRVRVLTNHYSVPVRLAGRRVEVRVRANVIEVLHGGKAVAEHERSYERHDERLQLNHYLELLRQRPGALARSTPLRQAREAGKWPGVYDELWQQLRQRHGEAEGTRQMVDVLMLHRTASANNVEEAIEFTLAFGGVSGSVVELLVRQLAQHDSRPAPLEGLGELGAYGEPVPTDLSIYDGLLGTQRGLA